MVLRRFWVPQYTVKCPSHSMRMQSCIAIDNDEFNMSKIIPLSTTIPKHQASCS